MSLSQMHAHHQDDVNAGVVSHHSTTAKDNLMNTDLLTVSESLTEDQNLSREELMTQHAPTIALDPLDIFRAKYFPDLDPELVPVLIIKNAKWFAEEFVAAESRGNSGRMLYTLKNKLSLSMDDGDEPMRRTGRIFADLKVNDYERYQFTTPSEFFLFLTRYNPDL